MTPFLVPAGTPGPSGPATGPAASLADRVREHTNGDARHAADRRTAARWRRTRLGVDTLVAGASVARSLGPVLRSLGFGEDELLRTLPLLTAVESLVYEMDRSVEREQRIPWFPVRDRWSGRILGLCASFGLHEARLGRVRADLAEFCRVETAIVRRGLRDEQQLLRMVGVRCFDLDLLTRIAATVVGRAWAWEVVDATAHLYVLADMEDDLRSVEKDRAAGTFNCYLSAADAWGADRARAVLDAELRRRCRLLEAWLETADDAAVEAFVVLRHEPATAAARDDVLTHIRGLGRRTAMDRQREALRAGADRAFAAYWRELDA